MAKGTLHVVYDGGGWAIKREKNPKVLARYANQQDAIEEARKMAWKTNDEVVVHNKQGQFKNKQGGKNPDDDNCFITTACVHHYQLSDDCYQLKTLRNFRDTYLRNLPDGNLLVSQYYSIAPPLVKVLNHHSEKEILYSEIFDQINQACALIELQKFDEAKELYTSIVTNLIEQFELA